MSIFGLKLLVLAVHVMVDLVGVAEGVRDHLDNPGTISNRIVFEYIMIMNNI